MLNLPYQMRFLPVLAATFLCSCASISSIKPPQNKPIPWANRAAAISSFKSWELNAQAAIRTPRHSETISLNWQQDKNDYSLLLYGPLGAQSITLKGTPGAVELHTTRGEAFYATAPEALLKQQTGWDFPVSKLFFWIRGIPAPDSPVHMQLDEFHHISAMQQDGWTVHYAQYQSIGQTDLPAKLTLERPPLKVKIFITHWEI